MITSVISMSNMEAMRRLSMVSSSSDRRGAHELGDRIDGLMFRIAWNQYELGLFDDRDEESRRSLPDMRRTPEHRRYIERARGWAPTMQRSFDTDFRSRFENYDDTRKSVGEDAPSLLETNDLVRMYDALQGISPYEQQSLRNEGSLSHLPDEENVRRLQWGEYLDRTVNSVGDKIQNLTSMMMGLGSDEGPHLNNPWCPSCGGRLVHPGEMQDYETDSSLDMAWAAHCNDCEKDFISYDGTDGVLHEECGGRNTVESGVEPYDILMREDRSDQEDNENYICPTCDSEFADADIEMMFPVDASSMGAYTQQLANAKWFVHSWNHELPIPQKIQMVQEMLMLIHDAGPLFNRFFGTSSKDDTIEIMRFLDLLSGNDLSKWRDPTYRNQRLKQPWNR